MTALALATVGMACLLWQFWPRDTVPLPGPASIGLPGPEPVPPPPPVATGDGTPAAPKPDAAAKKSGMLKLPDGSEVAPLNGVENPPRLVWQNPEYSPIVRTEHNGDFDWYVHADGSYSTTLMIWRSDLGRADAVSYCLHPRPSAPVAPLPPDGAIVPGR